ncbi:MAG: S24/S26 family peptidase [Clostridia bacterium]|nr:S24/S26 family peptidase [Clostridia bacterium]
MSNEQLVALISERLCTGGTASLTVTGNSMAPIFKSGVTVVSLKKCDNIRKYDIVLYQRQNGTVVLHRVIRVAGDTLVLRGDNDIQTEKGVPCAAVIGLAYEACTEGKRVHLQGIRNRMQGRYAALKRSVKRLFYKKR